MILALNRVFDVAKPKVINHSHLRICKCVSKRVGNKLPTLRCYE